MYAIGHVTLTDRCVVERLERWLAMVVVAGSNRRSFVIRLKCTWRYTTRTGKLPTFLAAKCSTIDYMKRQVVR